jgi:hypothetical protein
MDKFAVDLLMPGATISASFLIGLEFRRPTKSSELTSADLGDKEGPALFIA